MTNKEKQEKLTMADMFDPTGTVRAVLEELYKHPMSEWESEEVKQAIKEVGNESISTQ